MSDTSEEREFYFGTGYININMQMAFDVTINMGEEQIEENPNGNGEESRPGSSHQLSLESEDSLDLLHPFATHPIEENPNGEGNEPQPGPSHELSEESEDSVDLLHPPGTHQGKIHMEKIDTVEDEEIEVEENEKENVEPNKGISNADDSDDPDYWISTTGPNNDRQKKHYIQACDRKPLREERTEEEMRGDEMSVTVARPRYTEFDEREMIDYLMETGNIDIANQTKAWVFLSNSGRLSHERTAQSLVKYFKTTLHIKYSKYIEAKQTTIREKFRRVSQAIILQASSAKKSKKRRYV